MKYRRCDRRLTEKLLDKVYLDRDSIEDDGIPQSGHDGEWVNLGPIEKALTSYAAHLSGLPEMSGGRKDVEEGVWCGAVHTALKDIEAQCFRALEDPGFWSYLSLKYGTPIIRWRESRTVDAYLGSKGDPDKRARVLKYVYDESLTEGVLSRMYVRGRISEVDGDYSLAEARDYGGGKVGNTDLWRSHITRVQSGSSHPLARALAQYWNDHEEMTTNEIRDLAKLLKRRRSNIIPDILNDDEAKRVVEAQAAMIRRDES